MLSKGLKRGLAYVGVPVFFCVLGYVLAWLMITPVRGPLLAGASLLISDDAPNFNSNLTRTYDKEVAEATKAATTTPTQGTEPEQAATPAPAAEVESNTFSFPLSGEHYGQLTCERIGLDAPVYWYDSDEILAAGVGQSLMSLPPGYGTAIILAGHNLSYFGCLKDAVVGDVITFSTNYGTFEYQVDSSEVYNEDVLESMLADWSMSEYEQLIMYTCWPPGFFEGRKTDRLVVTAGKISGPVVNWRTDE